MVPMAVVAEIAEWDPPRHVAYRAVAGFATVRTDCTVEPEDGGCRLTIIAEGEYASRILRLLSPLAIAVAKRQADGDVKRLKAALESRTEQDL
jgi:hypothetical protein